MTCNTAPEAHMIKGRLENEGVACFLKNEESTNMLPMFNNMTGGGVQLMVFEKDAERARKILDEEFNEGDGE